MTRTDDERELVLQREVPFARDEVIEKYGAVEGGKQHLAKLEAYIRKHQS